MKHILLLTPGFPLNQEDSTTIPALQIYVKALKEMHPKFDIKVISFQYPFISKKYDWFNVKVFPLNGRNKRSNKFFVWKKAKHLLTKINQEKPIDIIHSFWLGECALVGHKFTKKHTIKHLVTAMGQDVTRNLFLKLFLKRRLKKTQIITLSKTHKTLLSKNHHLKSTIIPWGIHPKNFPKPQEKTIDILGVGSLNEVKNFNLFINIIAKINKKTPNLNVEIIGDGKLKKPLIKKVKAFDLQGIILIKGQLERNKVLTKMAKSKILLHTSSYESFGMVFLEALQSNMKIVSFNVGIAEISENWFVCKTEDEIVDNLEKVIREFKINSQKTSYTINETLKKYMKIYNE